MLVAILGGIVALSLAVWHGRPAATRLWSALRGMMAESDARQALRSQQEVITAFETADRHNKQRITDLTEQIAAQQLEFSAQITEQKDQLSAEIQKATAEIHQLRLDLAAMQTLYANEKLAASRILAEREAEIAQLKAQLAGRRRRSTTP